MYSLGQWREERSGGTSVEMVRNGRPPPDCDTPAIFGRITYVHRYRYKNRRQLEMPDIAFVTPEALLPICSSIYNSLGFTADMLLEPLRRISIGGRRDFRTYPLQEFSRVFGRPLLGVVIDMYYAESRYKPRCPFKVVHK